MNMSKSMMRLTYTFLGLFLVISLVMVNIQVFQAQDLQASDYNPRHCLPANDPASDRPMRGNIYDRNGILLVKSVYDVKAPCGYRRVWNPEAVSAGLGPLIGYFSYKYGASGIEKSYDDVLSGSGRATSIDSVTNHLLHRSVRGNDIYLTIDLKLQEQANALYNDPNNFYDTVCQPSGSDPPGSITVVNPQTGEVLAMVSRPYYDPSRVDVDEAYWQRINSLASAPLLNRASQGRYVPGSTFKTVTLTAALDVGKLGLDTTFSGDQILNFFPPEGRNIHWDDKFNGYPDPMSVEQAYAYSVNPVYARIAYQVGASTWLDYVRRYGIATPETSSGPASVVPAVPFDAPYYQSRAYTPGVDFSNQLLAESGFGQGQLLITPLTMAEITATIANDGQMIVPHVLYKQVGPGGSPSDVDPQVAQTYGQVMQPATAANLRQAMRAVYQYGTIGDTSHQPGDSPAIEGGKTGTGQLGSGLPHTWLLSLAPATTNTTGTLVVVVMKEHSGEGACQFATVDHVYDCAAADHDWNPPGGLPGCPVNKNPKPWS
jgi:penicillin-binding protein A